MSTHDETLDERTAKLRELIQTSDFRELLFQGIEVVRQGVWISDPARGFLYVNQAYADLYDASRDDFIGKGHEQVERFYHPEEWKALQEARKGRVRGEIAPGAYTHARGVRTDGSITHQLISSHALAVNGADYLVGITIDITERVAAYEKLRNTLEGTIHAIARVVETRDPYTAGHQARVATLACAIAEKMEVPKETAEGIQMAGVIHDLGKLRVPADILTNPGRLSDHEFGIIKTHPQVAYGILKDIEFTWPIADIVLQHHERFDGSGYPQGLAGEDILLEARILGVADVVEAMASHRPYRPSLGIDTALEEITAGKGTRYAPEPAEACLEVFADGSFSFEG